MNEPVDLHPPPPYQPKSMNSGKFVWAVVAILALAAGYCCWCALPLVWDGAFQLSVTLLRQEPFVYLTRFHTLILWQPTVWLSHFTANPMLLQAVYGLPFLLAPAVSVAVSWWLVKSEAPWLIIWPIFGVAAGTLPGQVFVINDSIWQQTLFWPIYLSVFVKMSRPQVWVLAILSIFQFVHQIGVPLLAGAAIAAVIMGKTDTDNRVRFLQRARIMGMLALLAIAKIVITNHIKSLEDTYAEREFAWWVVKERWNYGVAGYPLRGLICAWIAAFCLFLHCVISMPQKRRMVEFLTFALLVAAGGIWLYWAADAHRWNKALDYRRWILPLSLPFFILALLDESARKWRGRALPPLQSGKLRPAAALLLACIFAGVLGTQATVWWNMLRHLQRDVASSPAAIIPLNSIGWARGTPLDHWATSDAITLLEGKEPRKLLLTPEQVKDIYQRPPIVPNQGWFLRPLLHPPPPGPGGWYDFGPLLKVLAASTQPQSQSQENPQNSSASRPKARSGTGEAASSQ
jgi:hypothetical protein